MKRLAAILMPLVLAFGLLLIPAGAQAAGLFDGACSNGGASSAVCTDRSNTGNPVTGSNGLIIKIANVMAIIAGVTAIFVIIISGFGYITSGGEPAKAQAAKGTLIHALIGLAVIALADSIISLVLSKI